MNDKDPRVVAAVGAHPRLDSEPITARERYDQRERSAAAQADSDDALIARMAMADSDALAQLYARHGRAAYSLAVAITGDARAAEEVVQDAFVRAWRAAAAFEAQGRCQAWLLQIVRRLALDERRRRARQVRTMAWPETDLAVGADDAEQPEAMAVERDLALRVRRALAALTAVEREAVRVVYFGGLSQSEAAAALNIPLGTAKSRLRAAYEHLRAALEADRP